MFTIGMISKKAFKTFFFELVQECLTSKRRDAFFWADMWSLKTSVRRIAACACLCKSFRTLSFLLTF